MRNAHLDINEIINESLNKARTGLFNRLTSRRDPDTRLTVNGETVNEAELGEAQVQSLLAFRINPNLELALEDAERDNIIYDGLGEHRVLGKKKKKKKRMPSYGS